MKKFISYLIVILFSSLTLSAQSRTVTGTVSDESGSPLPGVTVTIKDSNKGTVTDINGNYSIQVTGGENIFLFNYVGYETLEVKINGRTLINVKLTPSNVELEEVSVVGHTGRKKIPHFKSEPAIRGVMSGNIAPQAYAHYDATYPVHNTEGYSTIHENGYKDVLRQPLSTFSIDVDKASYSNVRRFLNLGQLPPKDAVRIEEMINYFSYDYPEPDDEHPFSVTTELSVCPWNEGHQLLHVGLKGMEMEKEELPASNLVFLLDVSGSMNAPNKLPLLKSSFELLVKQ
ncbi:MAG: VWA domain-containing protein, partial [Bacteroidales bacterium]